VASAFEHVRGKGRGYNHFEELLWKRWL